MAVEVMYRPMVSPAAEFLRGEFVWRLKAPVCIKVILSLRAAMRCRLMKSD